MTQGGTRPVHLPPPGLIEAHGLVVAPPAPEAEVTLDGVIKVTSSVGGWLPRPDDQALPAGPGCHA
jgi:hypothetical protein